MLYCPPFFMSVEGIIDIFNKFHTLEPPEKFEVFLLFLIYVFLPIIILYFFIIT